MKKSSHKGKGPKSTTVAVSVSDALQYLSYQEAERIKAYLGHQMPKGCPIAPRSNGRSSGWINQSLADRALDVAQGVRKYAIASQGSIAACLLCSLAPCSARKFPYHPEALSVKTTKAAAPKAPDTQNQTYRPKSADLAFEFYNFVGAEFEFRRPRPLHIIRDVKSSLAIRREEHFTVREFESRVKTITARAKLNLAQVEKVIKIARAIIGPLITEIDANGLSRVLEIALKEVLESGYLRRSVLMQIGFGAPYDGVPARSVAYVLATLETLQRLHEIDVALPQLRVFSGQTAGIVLLGKNERTVRANTALMFTLIKTYAQRFYPTKVAEALTFDFDRYYVGEFPQIIEDLVRVFDDRTDSKTQRVREMVSRMAENHGGDERSAAKYTACHVPMFADATYAGTAASKFLENWGGGRQPEVLINCGARAEIEFYRARMAIAANASKYLKSARQNLSIQLITVVGWELPPYYFRPHDLNWAALVDLERHGLQAFDADVRFEIEQMINAAGGLELLIEWVREVHSFFALVESTGAQGPNPNEMLGYSILGCPILLQEALKSKDDWSRYGIDLTTTEGISHWIANLSGEEEERVVRLCRQWYGMIE